MADLLYTIGADASNFNTNVKGLAATAQDASAGVTGALDQAGHSVNNLGNQAQSASMRFMTMRSGLSALRDGTLAFAVGGQRADMMFMAMGHHITSLVNETGSLGGAMRALGSSVFGVGGAILALTIAYEIYEKTTKRAKEETKDYISTLDSVRQATLKGQEAGQGEITRLQILYRATQDHTLSLKDRNLAYDELERKYPTFFTNADREKTLLGDNTAAYNALAGAILAAAAAKAYENQIGENSNRIFTNIQKGNDELKKQAQLQKEVADLQKSLKASDNTIMPVGGSTGTASTNTADTEALSRRTAALKETTQAIRDLNKDTEKLNKANADLVTLSEKAEKSAAFKTEIEDSKKAPATKKEKSELAELEEQLKKLQSAEDDLILKGHRPDFFAPTELEREINGLKTLIENVKALNAEQGKMPDDIKTPKFISPKLDTQFGDKSDIQGMTEWNKKVIENIALMQKSRVLTAEYKKDLKEEDSELRKLSHTIGEGLGRALESALNGTQNFFNAMGQFLTKLLEQLIAAIAEALILATILSIFSGGTVSVMGELSNVSAFGGMASMGAGLIPHHASGGIFTTPHMGVFGEAGPEAIVTPKHLQEFAGINGGNGSVKMEPFLIGSDMWFKQTNRTNKTIGRTS